MRTHPRLSAVLTLLVAMVLGIGVLGGCAPGNQQASSSSGSQSASASSSTSSQASATGNVDVAATFPSWNPKSESLAKLIDYVKDVTNKDSANYVEPAERIATFDMDGTLLCEKAPVYVDWCMLMHRVFDDPTYNAPAEYKETCNKIRESTSKGVVPEELDDAKNEMLVNAFKDMTPEDFRAYVNNFIDTVKVEGFDGMTYGQSIYKPMKEVVDYLKANDFDVRVVSACEREVARAIAGSKFGIAPDHIIGTDWGTKASKQGDEAVNKYTFKQDDKLLFDGTKDLEVAKLNKVVFIERELGRRPILAFGNSSGDYAMLNYAQSNPDHKGMGLLVLCDDVNREYGDTERATKQSGEAAEEGWTTFSMANDWSTIYGDGVTKTQLPADQNAQLAQAA